MYSSIYFPFFFFFSHETETVLFTIRAVIRAPYQVNQQPEAASKASGSNSANETGPEPELEAEAEEGFPRHLDLNL